MNEVIIAAVQAALELTKLSISEENGNPKRKTTKAISDDFVTHYAAIIGAIRSNPVQGKAKTNE